MKTTPLATPLFDFHKDDSDPVSSENQHFYEGNSSPHYFTTDTNNNNMQYTYVVFVIFYLASVP